MTAQPWKDPLDRLEKCGQRLSTPTGSRIEELARGLSSGLKGLWAKTAEQKKSTPSPEYLDNLSELATVCELGSLIRQAEASKASLAVVEQDLEAKLNDCRRFGMARQVPLEIKTVKGGQPVPDWEVFYIWEGGSSLAATELRFPGLTPATGKLAPGIYSFQARKGGQQSGKVRVPVAGTEKVSFEIPVP